MAYMKKDLLGPHHKAAVMDRGLIRLKGRTMERRFPRDNFHGLPSGWQDHIKTMPRPTPNGAPFHGGRPITHGGRMIGGNSTFPTFHPGGNPGGHPGMVDPFGSMSNPFTDSMGPTQDTFQPGGNYGGGPVDPNFEGPGGYGGNAPDMGPPQQRHMPPGFGGGGMPPNLMELIKQLMGQGGGGFQPGRSRWEGTMNPNFGRPQNFGVS